MVEASISLPVIILVVMLMLRLFTFYLEILNSGIKDHEEAIKKWRESEKIRVETITKSGKVSLIGGGILKDSVCKKTVTKIYLFNEDQIVRMGEIDVQE